MATASRRPRPGLSEALEREPWRFDFVQAVRLIERIVREQRAGRAPGARNGDAVRFRALPQRSFAAAEVVELKGLRPSAAEARETPPPQMQVSFMGLTGPSGVLPEWYLDLLLTRIRQRDFALRDFLDLFNHRTVSLFYRAWEKYRFEIGFERARLTGRVDDPFSRCLRCLVGLGTDNLAERQAVADEALMYYGGHFSHGPRSLAALESMLPDFLHCPAKVLQFHGRWLALDEEDCTRVSARARSRGANACLGADAVLGARVWDVESGVRIQVGPLAYEPFTALLPGTPGFERLEAFVRAYLGPGLDVDLQLLLAPAEVPLCQLRSTGEGGRRLGWNGWLLGTDPHIRSGTVVFKLDDWDSSAGV